MQRFPGRAGEQPVRHHDGDALGAGAAQRLRAFDESAAGIEDVVDDDGALARPAGEAAVDDADPRPFFLADDERRADAGGASDGVGARGRACVSGDDAGIRVAFANDRGE